MNTSTQMDEGLDEMSGPFAFNVPAAGACNPRCGTVWRVPYLGHPVSIPICLVGLGLPRLLLASRLGLLPAGWFNLEFLALGAAGLFLPRGAVFLLLMAECCGDFVYAVCSTYQFRLGDLMAAASSFATLPGRQVWALAVGAVAVPAMCAGVALLPRPRGVAARRWMASWMLALAGLLLAVAIGGGQDRLRHHDGANPALHLVRTPVLSLAMREMFLRRVEASAKGGNEGSRNAASAGLTELLAAGERPDIVLVLVESWGLALDPATAALLTETYDDAGFRARYRVERGTVEFDGATVSAEARELCRSRLGFGMLHLTAAQAGQCLPAETRAAGYENLSVHGYAGRMFQRADWYRRAGFERSWFGADLDEAGLPRCAGAFTGTCDAAVAGWIGETLLAPAHDRPRLVYWVTLNSHLPVPVGSPVAEDGVCGRVAVAQDSAALCMWMRLVRNVHGSVRELALRPHARKTVFLLVGDHAPPFAATELRRQFSQGKVPWVMLVPR